jgi:hypothetical protein
MTPSPVFDPIRIVSLLVAVAAALVLWRARRRMVHKYVATWMGVICIHVALYYCVLLVDRIAPIPDLPDLFFTNWSALLRLHELGTILLIAIYLWGMPYHAK